MFTDTTNITIPGCTFAELEEATENYQSIFTIQYTVPLFFLCTKSLIAVLKDAKQLSEENGGSPFC